MDFTSVIEAVHNQTTGIPAIKLWWRGNRVRVKMEHKGKMEHSVFWKKHARCGSLFASAWFPSLISVVRHIKIELVDNHLVNTTQKLNFPILMNFDIFNPLTFRRRLHWQNKSLNSSLFFKGIIYLFHVFSSHFDKAIGDFKQDMTHYVQTFYRD